MTLRVRSVTRHTGEVEDLAVVKQFVLPIPVYLRCSAGAGVAYQSRAAFNNGGQNWMRIFATHVPPGSAAGRGGDSVRCLSVSELSTLP